MEQERINEQGKEEAVYSKHVVEMLTVANEYCYFMEHADGFQKIDIIEFMHKILPMLYLKGIFLPLIVPQDSSYNQCFVNEVQWEHLFNLLREKFGEEDLFWVIKNTGINDAEPQRASLSELFADIYQDMKDMLVLYQNPMVFAKENAVAQIKNHFQNHWGERAILAAKKLHELLYISGAASDTPLDFLD